MATPNSPYAPTVMMPRGRRWPRLALLLALMLLAALVLGLIAARLYFSDAYLKGRVERGLRDVLGRECRVARLELNLWSGRLTLDDVRVLEVLALGDAIRSYEQV